MSAPTEPSATASEPRLPGRSSSWTRSRYEGTRNTVAQSAGSGIPADPALGPVGAGTCTFARCRRPTRLVLVSQISRDEVAHLARLARLALTDDELDSFAGQLDAILEHVSQIQAVDVTDVDATDNPLEVRVNVTRPDVVAAVPDPGARRWPRRPRRSRAASRCRGSWGRRNEIERPDQARRRDAGRQDRGQGAVLGRGHPGLPGPDRRHRRALPRLPARRRGRRRWPRPPASTPPSPPASSCRHRWPVCRWRSRTSSPPRTCRPPAGRRSSRAGRRRTTRP